MQESEEGNILDKFLLATDPTKTCHDLHTAGHDVVWCVVGITCYTGVNCRCNQTGADPFPKTKTCDNSEEFGYTGLSTIPVFL